MGDISMASHRLVVPTEQELRLGLEDSVAEGVEGVFFLKLSQKLTPLEIKLEKFRLRLSPNKGLCEWSCGFFFSSFGRRGPGRVLYIFELDVMIKNYHSLDDGMDKSDG